MRYNQEAPQLAKRGKSVCSYCGKKTFVNYIYSDGTPVADGVCGKCDRADNCGVHYPPREYFKDNPRLDSARYTRFRPQRKRPVITPPSYIDSSLMMGTMRGYEKNPLAKFLHSIFDAKAGTDIVQANIERYAVGTSSKYNGSAIFWQIDQFGRIRSGQIIGYDSTTGKRNHKQQNWVHSVMESEYPDFKLEQCYFGSHLINAADKVVAEIHREWDAMPNMQKCEVEPIIYLFESPKAAVIMSIALMWGGCRMTEVPMATCSCGNLNPSLDSRKNPYNKIQVLKNRKVVLFPDNGKFEEWKAKGEQLKGFCKEVWISTAMERNLHPHTIDCEIEDGDGFDDVILRYVQAGKPIWDLITSCYGYHGQWQIV